MQDLPFGGCRRTRHSGLRGLFCDAYFLYCAFAYSDAACILKTHIYLWSAVHITVRSVSFVVYLRFIVALNRYTCVLIRTTLSNEHTLHACILSFYRFKFCTMPSGIIINVIIKLTYYTTFILQFIIILLPYSLLFS